MKPVNFSEKDNIPNCSSGTYVNIVMQFYKITIHTWLSSHYNYFSLISHR